MVLEVSDRVPQKSTLRYDTLCYLWSDCGKHAGIFVIAVSLVI